MQTRASNRFIDPKTLAGLKSLSLVAKAVVEGFIAGLHRSPFHGFSLEFSEYREYSPGDDIRRVDWKVYARSDRFYVKKFEGDTNARIFILVDASASMGFASQQLSKLDYARFLAASLSHLATRQGDAVSLISFDSEIRKYLPPSNRPGQFNSILHYLEAMKPSGETNLEAVLDSLARLIRNRSMVVLISDLYHDANSLAKALRFFHHRGNDLILFHLLDPMEIELPFDGISTLQDLETGEQIPFSSEQSRHVYLQELEDHMRTLKKECQNVRIDYELLSTEKPLDLALNRYLATRGRRM